MIRLMFMEATYPDEIPGAAPVRLGKRYYNIKRLIPS